MAVVERTVLVGIRLDEHSRELLNWALVKVANSGDRVVAVHVCRNSDSALEEKPLLDSYLDDYEGLCNKKQVDLTGMVLKGSSIRKVLVREAKNCAAVAVILGITKPSALGGWASMAKYCAKKLPPATEVLAINRGKVVFRRCSNSKITGFSGDPNPSFYLTGNPNCKDNQSEFSDAEMSEIGKGSPGVRHSFDLGCRDVSGDSSSGDFSPSQRHRRALSSVSSFVEEIAHQRPGWPLLRAPCSLSPTAQAARKMSVVQWVMTLPSRSLPDSPRSTSDISSSKGENALDGESEKNKISKLPENLKLLLKTESSGCKWFSHDILKTATSNFSSDNLIGKGGCNCVYKGLLPDGKPVAVKILKSSKEAWKDFTLEVQIMNSLNHENIAPLLGICIEDTDLISVYDFMSKGNLEENLYGNDKDKSALPWEMRFNIAVGIAEALNYLHNQCVHPVIHRDVKSSNILLFDDCKPQLSDFGLAIWGPKASSFMTHGDVVGTFGYLAPEYFMYGKVSEKMDVYSFGVVLLELLSGRKSISLETPRGGQESLVMWAKPKLESGDLTSILDPNLDKNVNNAHVQRMALAAILSLTQAARLRPNMSKILKILRGEKDVDDEVITECVDEDDLENKDNNDDDEVYPESCTESHLGLALLDADDINSGTSFSSMEQSSLEEYLKGRWSRSSSLD